MNDFPVYAFLTTDTIEELHVEITNVCNAACPMCARNIYGVGLSPNPGWGSWKDGDELLVFNKNLHNLNRVFFCGTHGDPIAHPRLLEIVTHCKSLGLRLEIFTNGSLRSNSWWKELAIVLDEKDKIIFGIDGIETNHLYRQNTNIEKVLSHLKICSEGRPQTQWDFLAFKHNEHELELCKETAKKLKVDKFRIRKTARFGKGNKFPVKDDDNQIVRYLEPPISMELQHPNLQTIQKITKELPTTYNINCLYKEAKKMYVNSRLDVFPCCYISDDNENMSLNSDLNRLQFPLSDVNLRDNSWEKILDNKFFKEDLMKSFSQSNTIRRCVYTCGVIPREQNQNQQVEINQPA